MKHVLGFSGGADSQACALWMRQRFAPQDVILTNSTAGGNEHPLTTEFIQWYSAHVFPVVMIDAIVADLGNCGTRPGQTRDRRREFQDDEPLTFDRLSYVKGRFPSRKAQFCTQHLKLQPHLRWLNDNLRSQGIAFDRYTGVRRDESHLRRCVKDCEYDTFFDCMLWRPIAGWSKLLVFASLREAGEPVNPLYTMGFDRVGCAPCVNSNKKDINTWACRFPEMIDKVREWEKRVGRTFFAPVVPGKRINWIDEVVAWSKTERGGKQLSLPMIEAEAATGMCVSKYGLCE